jgi:hypothetical protein
MKILLVLLLLSISFSTFAEWKLIEQVDDFEETKSYFINSDKVDPNKPMSWPHDKAKAYLYFQCGSKVMSMWASMNNLVNKDSYSGDDRYIYINLKIDGEIHRDIKTNQNLLSSWFHWTIGQIDLKMINAKEVIVQLDHFGQGKRTYSFNMEGLKPLMVNQCSLPDQKTSAWIDWLNGQ